MGENWETIRQGADLVENIMRQTPGTVNIDNAIGKT